MVPHKPKSVFLPPSPSRVSGMPARCKELGDGTRDRGAAGTAAAGISGSPDGPSLLPPHHTHARSAWLSDQYVFMLHWETKKKKWEGKGGEDDVFSTGTVADNCLQEICLNTWWLLDPEMFAVALNRQLQTPVPDKSSHAGYKRHPHFSPKNPLSHLQQASCSPRTMCAHRHHLLPGSCPLPSIPAPLHPRTCLGLQEQSASPHRRGPHGTAAPCSQPTARGARGPSPPSLLLKDFKASHFPSPITPAQYPRPGSVHAPLPPHCPMPSAER